MFFQSYPCQRTAIDKLLIIGLLTGVTFISSSGTVYLQAHEFPADESTEPVTEALPEHSLLAKLARIGLESKTHGVRYKAIECTAGCGGQFKGVLHEFLRTERDIDTVKVIMGVLRHLESEPTDSQEANAYRVLSRIGAEISLKDGHVLIFKQRSAKLSSHHLALLKHFPYVDYCHFYQLPDSKGLAALSGLQNLRHLYLPELIGNESMQYIKPIKTLEILHLPSRIDDEGFAVVYHLPNLKTLTCRSKYITDEALAHLANCSKLEEIELVWWDSLISDKGIKTLANLKQLKTISTGGVDITDQSWHEISKLQSLESLRLNGSGIKGKSLGELSKLQHLKELALPWFLQSEYLVALQNLQHVETLELPGPYPDDIVEYLLAMPKLKKLRMLGTTLSPTALARLHERFGDVTKR